jgi:hypothetical protein
MVRLSLGELTHITIVKTFSESMLFKNFFRRTGLPGCLAGPTLEVAPDFHKTIDSVNIFNIVM